MKDIKHSTTATDEEKENGVMDDSGGIYSPDGKRLLEISLLNRNSKSSYTVKDGTEVICDDAFMGCISLKSIVLPKSVELIGKAPFTIGTEIVSHSDRFAVKDGLLIDLEEKRLIQCISNEKHIEVPDTIEQVGDSAFYYCSLLKSIVFPQSIKVIGQAPFHTDNARSYTDMKIVSHSDRFVVKDGLFIDLEEKRLIRCISNEKHIVVTDGIVSIGNNAFEGCRSLQSIVLPDSVTAIGECGFVGCESLQSIVLSQSLASIEDWVFNGCKSLQSIVLPNSVTTIGDNAFEGCKSLQTIVLPNSLISIGDIAFARCESVQNIILPNSVTHIGDCAFSGCKSLQSIVLPELVTSIGDRAFAGCESLQTIVLPKSLTSIGDETFFGCTSLQGIVIPDLVTSIGDSAFADCKSLQTIVVPDSVISIGYGVFTGCISLQSYITI